EALILLEISGSAALMAASHYSLRASGPVVACLAGSAGTSALFRGTGTRARRNRRPRLRAASPGPRGRDSRAAGGAVRTRRAQGSTREIGRASCRESVETSGVYGSVKTDR